MRKTALFTALGCLLLCQSAHSLPSAPQEQIGDLLVTLSDMQTIKTDGRYTAQLGFHYVRVNVAVRNVGRKTVCTQLSAGLETSLGGGHKFGHVRLTARNKTDTLRMGYIIHQMLPSEEAEGYIIFGDVRDGVVPESLTIRSGGQSCDSASYTYELLPAVTFIVTSSQNRFVIASKKPDPNEPAQLVTSSEPPAPPKPPPTPPQPCEAANLPPRASAPIGIDLPDPDYTDEARRAKLEGKAEFCATVGIDGLLHDIQPLNHLGMGLDEQALVALSKWRFTAAMLGGKLVPRVILVEVSFRLHML